MENVILEATAIGVQKVFVPGIDLQSSNISIKIALKFPNTVFPFVGIHPNYSVKNNSQLIEELIKAKRDQIYAVGEIGLDFYRDFAPHTVQIEMFENMLNLAKKYNLPICIHNRDADDEIINVLSKWYTEKSESSENGITGIFHAFNGSNKIAEFGKAYGFAFGIGGQVTYKKANQLREIIKRIGVENIVLETDAPYLSPVPFRGKRNVPKNIHVILKALSEILNVPNRQIEELTDNNAYRFLLKKKMP